MEIYKDIIGYNGLYQISNFGNVKSFKRKMPTILKLGMMTSGYLFANLKLNKMQKNESVHRLVAKHFIYHDNHNLEVNHKNGIKTDNRVENLEWVTRSQNIQHSYDNGLKKYRPLHYKGKFGDEHNKSKKVLCKETGEVFGSYSEAERKLKIGSTGVSWSIRNNKSIRGYTFEDKL